jgi:cardiolipin synthase
VRHLPNLICLARIALIWPIAIALTGENYDLALLLFSAAAASDGVDGYLAKRFGWTSDLGKILDPIADKALLITVFVVGTHLGLVPWWLTLAAVTRDVSIVLGVLALRIWVGPLRGHPSITSKINTVLQLGYLLGVMTHAAVDVPSRGLLTTLAVVTVVTTLLSGVNYARDFAHQAWGVTPKTD